MYRRAARCFPKLSVYENLKLGLEAAAGNKAAFLEEEIYALFPILKEFRRRLGGNLSGGQQQQLAIARVLVVRAFLSYCWTSPPKAFSLPSPSK